MHSQTQTALPLMAPPRARIEIAPALPALPSSTGAPSWAGAAVTKAAPAVQSGRCSEKGCVFPSAIGTGGRCVYHQRQATEPILFSSFQPTHVVLEQARFSVMDSDVDVYRMSDRRQMTAEREAFLEE